MTLLERDSLYSFFAFTGDLEVDFLGAFTGDLDGVLAAFNALVGDFDRASFLTDSFATEALRADAFATEALLTEGFATLDLETEALGT